MPIALPDPASLTHLTIARLPENLRTYERVAPDAVETFPGVEVESIEDTATITGALAALEASLPQESDVTCDARYALAFFRADGTRALHAVADKFGMSGTIDDRSVSYGDGALLAWLFARYPAVSVG